MVLMRTPSAVCCTSIWIFCANDSASSRELACARMDAEILTSRPASAWSLISPNLWSIQTDWPPPRETVLWKSRVTCSCPGVDAAATRPAANISRVSSQSSTQARPVPHDTLLRVFPAGPVIAFPPESLQACAVFPDTSRAIDNAGARSMGFDRSAIADHLSRCRAAAAFRDSWLSALCRDFAIEAWPRWPACRWLEHRRTPRAPHPSVLCSSTRATASYPFSAL